MTDNPNPSLSNSDSYKVLVVAPTFNDSAIAVNVFKEAGISALACKDLEDLCGRTATDVGAIIISEEALLPDHVKQLHETLEKQEAWSDLPIILLTGADVVQATAIFSKSGNISLLERPFAKITLIRSVEVALRARKRQYEVRDLLKALRKSKDEADNANIAKTQFLANMSHEIRTPIGAILGFTDLMKNPSNSSDENLTYMNIVERNSQQLLRLIDDILDLSKVEAGKMAIENIRFSLTDWLADLNSAMLFKASEKGIAFHLQIQTPIPDHIFSDPIRLRQIVLNVIGNAIKFTDRGMVTMSVNYTSNQLTFTVKDTGIGISDEQVKNLFKPFSQADSSTTRKFGGTGLGLVLSKRLAEALGGDLILTESRPNLGSLFTITTEVEVPADSRMVSTNQPSFTNISRVEDNAENILKGLKVLLVEDAPDNQMLIKIYLSKTGVDLKIVGDGVQGVDTVLKENFDVVLMDVQMPYLDGHAATKKLRALNYKKPIIALTAHAMSEERERCFASGFTDFLTKPIKRDVLIKVLNQYLV